MQVLAARTAACISFTESLGQVRIAAEASPKKATGTFSGSFVPHPTLKPIPLEHAAFASATANPPSEISLAELTLPVEVAAIRHFCIAIISCASKSKEGGDPHKEFKIVRAYSEEPNSRRLCCHDP